MQKIQLLVGEVASGKSTYAKNAARMGIIIINDDSIVNTVHADEYTLYNTKLKPLYKSVENHILSIALALGRSVLVDRGLNGSVHGRQRWIAMARSLDVSCDAVVFPFDGEDVHADRRFNHDPRGHDFTYWLDVVKAHRSEYQEPSLSEGIDAIHSITFDEIKEGKVIL
jgi:predicted kinase